MSRKSGFTGANAIPLGPRNPAIGAKRSFSAMPPKGPEQPQPPPLLPFQKQESTVSSNAATALRMAQAAAANLAKLQNLKPAAAQSQPQEAAPSSGSDEGRGRPKKKRSRWSTPEVKTEIPGIPAKIPPNLTKEQQSAYITQLQIEDVTRKLKSGDLGIPANPEDRSPSPEPIYNNEGKRLNTREYRTRKRLEEERHRLIQEMTKINENYKPPMDYKPPVQRISEQIMIPADLNPSINFVGLLIGPRGNTLKKIEKDCQCKIMIRGKGSVKEGKIGRKDGLPLPGEDEPLHALVTGTTIENVQKACKEIHQIIKQGIEQPEGQNDLRKLQLMELARLNGTLRDDAMPREREWLKPENQNITNTTICTKCGGRGHIAQDCMAAPPSVGLQQQEPNQGPMNEVDKAKMDSEYMSLMAELGEGPAPDSNSNSGGNDGGGGGNQQFGGNRPPWMSGPRAPYGGGGGGHMGGYNGPPGSYNGPPNMMGGNRPPPWMRGSPRGGGRGNYGGRGRGGGNRGRYQNNYGGYNQGNMGGQDGNMGGGNMGWGMGYDNSMSYNMDGGMGGMGGGMGMNPPPPPPPGNAPQQPPPPPSGNNSGSWQGDQSWNNSDGGDKGQEQGDQGGGQGDGNDYSGNQNSGNMGNQQMGNNMMGGYGNMMGYGMWGGMGNMAQPPMPPGPGPVPPPPPSGGGSGNNSGSGGGNNNSGGNSNNQSGNNQWGMDYSNMGGGMNMMGMGMMGYNMAAAPPPPPPSS